MDSKRVRKYLHLILEVIIQFMCRHVFQSIFIKLNIVHQLCVDVMILKCVYVRLQYACMNRMHVYMTKDSGPCCTTA